MVWAVALVALMALTAMAVDLGNIAQTKQHANNAVDDAALAGVVDLAPLANGGVAATAEQQAVADAEAYLSDNYSSINFNFDGCSGELPSSIYIYAAADCFGFFNPSDPSENQGDPTAMAVAIPTQSVGYTLGKAAGLRSQAISSVGYAELATATKSYILPFGYSAGGGSGLECLKTGSGKKAADCTGFATGSGQFGQLDSPRYTIYPGSAPSAGNNSVVEADIALGIDHRLNAFGSPEETTEICDANGSPPNCPSYDNKAPYDNADYAAPSTGQTLTDPTAPLFTGGFSFDGCTFTPRLSHPDGFTAQNGCSPNPYPAPGASGPYLDSRYGDTFGSTYQLNGVHISRYLSSTGQNLASSCSSLAPRGGATSVAIDVQSAPGTYVWQPYDNCLSPIIQVIATAAATSPPPAIFSSSIESSPRFGIVPVVAGSNGTNAEQIEGFDAVYLDLAFGNGKVDSILAWVFPIDLIQGTSQSGSGFSQYIGGNFVANLCSYNDSFPKAGTC